MESPKRILGIEGGGTKTEWVLLSGEADEQKILSQGQLSGSNLRLTSDDALARLFAVLPADATHVGVFLAGCATDEDRTRLRGLVEKAWPRAVLAAHADADVVWSALARAASFFAGGV